MFHVQIENLMLFLVSLMYSLGTKCSIKEELELESVISCMYFKRSFSVKN